MESTAAATFVSSMHKTCVVALAMRLCTRGCLSAACSVVVLIMILSQERGRVWVAIGLDCERDQIHSKLGGLLNFFRRDKVTDSARSRRTTLFAAISSDKIHMYTTPGAQRYLQQTAVTILACMFECTCVISTSHYADMMLEHMILITDQVAMHATHVPSRWRPVRHSPPHPHQCCIFSWARRRRHALVVAQQGRPAQGQHRQ
jgi:hypothetical protein